MYRVIPKKISRLIFSFFTSLLIFTAAFLLIVSFALQSFNKQTIVVASESTAPVIQQNSELRWGLSFQGSSNAPTPDFTAQELAPYNAFYINENSQNTIYLTFDSGYENGNTAIILDSLLENNVKAAFFVVDDYIKENPDLVIRMISEGHIVGNHSYKHPNMAQLNEEDFKNELQNLEHSFFEITGKEISKFYRPPEGSFTFQNLQWASELGYKTVFWSLAYVDWDINNQPSKEYAFEKLLPRTHKGAVVLLHSASNTNAEILSDLIKIWKQQGYTFGDLSQLGG